jgi:hypothetical protein
MFEAIRPGIDLLPGQSIEHEGIVGVGRMAKLKQNGLHLASLSGENMAILGEVPGAIKVCLRR